MEEAVLNQIIQAIGSVRYGTIQLVIQDAKIVRLEKTEKIRLNDPDQTTGGL